MATEKRLIDANAVDYENIMCSQSQLHWLNAIIEKQPTVDAVEVVRCKDCEKWSKRTGFCDEHSHFFNHGMYWDVFNEDDFCSYGERKDNG